MISERTKAGLQAAKARGQRLGRPELAEKNKAEAVHFANALRPMIDRLTIEAQRKGKKLNPHSASVRLNDLGIASATGRPWSAKTVGRLMARL